MGSGCGRSSEVRSVELKQDSPQFPSKPARRSTLPPRSISDQSLRESLQESFRQISWQRGNQIGAGMFGTVYQAMNLTTGELLAVKTLKLSEDRPSFEKDLANIRRELCILRSMDHPNIIKYFQTDFVTEDCSVDILMEYIPSGSLNSLIAKYRELNEAVIRNYTKQLLRGLEYLHGLGIVHRDLKSANILVSEDGVLKLSDFGCSRKFDTENSWSQSFKGSPYWMAPEVVLRERHSCAADIWSVGCLVIEMATGKPPWSNYSNQAKTILKMIAEPGRIPDLPKVSRELRDFIVKCLQRDPIYRPSAKDMLKHAFLAAGNPPMCYNGIRTSSRSPSLNSSNAEKHWRRQETL